MIISQHLFHNKLENCKKIVATTDKSIGYTDHLISPVPNFCDYPQLPESFIQAYIKAYNEGKPITEVDLEMEEYINSAFEYKGKDDGLYIKTRPDNTVIVHQSKMYSREEVEELCNSAHLAGRNLGLGQSYNYSSEDGYPNVKSRNEDFNKWKQDHL